MADDILVREQERLAALECYDVLDTPPEEAFDRITRLIRLIFDVPVATVTMVDGHRLWFKSRQGLPAGDLPRANSICDTVVAEGVPLVLPDTTLDERFQANPHVTHGAQLRFYAGYPLRTPDGLTIGMLCAADTRPRQFGEDRLGALADLAQIVMRELELRSVATHDALTGALSRRTLREEVDHSVSLARRHTNDLSCIVFDLDDLSAVTAAHGRAASDRLLCAVVETCRTTLRKSDLLGRVGDKQFGVVLPHTGRGKALTVAEKLRAAIAQVTVIEADAELKVTASLGIAALDRGTSGSEQLLQRAADALDAAKQAGGNSCVVAPVQSETGPIILHRVLKAGRIVLNGGYSTIDCTIRGLSEAGASIHVASTAGIPSRFDLMIGGDRVAHASEIVLKRDRRIDLRFVA